MQLEQVLAFGIAPNDANISYANAKAIAAFLANIDELKVGTLAVMVQQGAPGEWKKYTIAEIEGVIPETAVLEFYLWLGGIPDNEFSKWHNVRAIEKMLTQNPRIEVGLNFFLSQFSAGLYMMGTSFAQHAATEAVIKAWTDVHGVPVTPVEPEPTIPPMFPGDLPVVGNPSFVHNRYNLGRLASNYEVGATYTDERGTFVKHADYWEKQD